MKCFFSVLVQIAIGSLVIVAAVVALVVSITASTLACQIFCCGKRQGQVHQVRAVISSSL